MVESLKPGASEYTLWDSDLSGYGIRVRPNGAMSYIAVYRAGHGRKAPVRKLTLCAVGKITPDEARSLARKALGSAAHGQDPAAEKAASCQSMTVSELAEAFLAEHVEPKRKAKTVEGYRHAIRSHVVPEIGTVKADQLTRAAVTKLHLKLKDRPSAANYVLAVVGSMYGFGQRCGYVPEGHNPAERIDRYAEQSRERFLTSAELTRLGEAMREAETVGLPWELDAHKPKSKHAPRVENRRTVFAPSAVAAVRLLLLTGCRLREILNLQWSYIDFERGMLFIPDSKTGRKPVVLNAASLAILGALPQDGLYVVPGNDPKRPRHDLQRIWSSLTRRAQLQGVRLHDLRHTFASVGAADGLGLPIVGKLLGHAQAATTARYAHLDNDPVRRASERISSKIQSALNQSTALNG
ncbi:site-specific integrase [Methylobacterium sp. E-016]|nr:site-specific integrase [Methylobacterium sp. E-016]